MKQIIHNIKNLLRNYSPGRRDQRGQDMVEFSLLFTLFMVVALAIIEFSVFFYFLSSLNAASRNSARFAIAENNLVDCSGIQAAVSDKAIPIIGSFDDISIKYTISGSTYQCPLSGDPLEFSAGDEIVVSVSSTYDPIIPLFDSILQREYTSNSSRSVLVNLELAP